MTPERAAEHAANILDIAEHADNDRAIALVAVGDAWARLHTALANAPKTIEPAPGEPAEIASLSVEVRQLVHAVDRMRDDWAEASPSGRRDLWTAVHEANDAVWDART